MHKMLFYHQIYYIIIYTIIIYMKERDFFMVNINIKTDHITLGQFLKLSTIAPSGGLVKAILEEYKISVNGIQENRRGKKLFPGDKITVKTVGEFRITKQWI